MPRQAQNNIATCIAATALLTATACGGNTIQNGDALRGAAVPAATLSGSAGTSATGTRGSVPGAPSHMGAGLGNAAGTPGSAAQAGSPATAGAAMQPAGTQWPIMPTAHVNPGTGQATMGQAGQAGPTSKGPSAAMAMNADVMGTAPTPGTADLSSCPTPPANSPADAVAALNAVNTVRLKTGAGCMSLQPALDKSATNHCQYNAMNQNNTMCQAGGHSEVMSCMAFTGVDVGARVRAAGYPGRAGVTEVLTQGGTPEQAVMGWIDTLWHRIPTLDPWTTDMGWGSANGCRVIDFGAGMNPAPKDLVTVYPYDGQTDFPVSFNGLESPQPPAPPDGFPSSSMISVYAQNIQVTEHVLTKDGDATPIEHIWIDKNSPQVMAGYRYYLVITSFLYAYKPFEPNTKYHVKIVGSHTGGPLNLEWTFTTGAAPKSPWGF